STGLLDRFEAAKVALADPDQLVAGDELIRIGERDLRGLKAIEQTSAVNSIRNAPVAVVAQHEGGTTENVSLAQGPCYPTHDEIANLK
ncbi:MAG: hypothetical protein AAGA56_18140, partial [Myxococcota bacterium]